MAIKHKLHVLSTITSRTCLYINNDSLYNDMYLMQSVYASSTMELHYIAVGTSLRPKTMLRWHMASHYLEN